MKQALLDDLHILLDSFGPNDEVYGYGSYMAWNDEKRALRERLDAGGVVDKSWLLRPLVVPYDKLDTPDEKMFLANIRGLNYFRSAAKFRECVEVMLHFHGQTSHKKKFIDGYIRFLSGIKKGFLLR